MENVIRLYSVGFGGFIGAILCYLVSGRVRERTGSIVFFYGTMAVNLLGCFIIGLLIFLVETGSFFWVEIRVLSLSACLGRLRLPSFQPLATKHWGSYG